MINIYKELLEYIHSRYCPRRPDNPTRQRKISLEENIALDSGVKRLPCELERRFFDILYIIVKDWWYVSDGNQWIDILRQIGAFEPESELMRDNVLRDGYEFFRLAG